MLVAPEPPTLVAPTPEPAPAVSETSPNLIDNNNWNGATYGADPGGCCSSISGSGALYDTTTDTIMFSYGQDILNQTIAINQALQQSGVEVDGYNYAWSWRTISNSGNGGDTLQFEVTVKDASGNEVERYVYDYSSSLHAMDVWHTESGTETFTQSYLDPQNISLTIIGKDGGFWAGYYGPEVRDVSLTLNYSANPCAANPLYDPSCDGYAEAYAQQQYDASCQANPMYDSGCPGYQQAYYNQQCTNNPLYDSGCPGYADAYFNQQCALDGLYSESCPNYADAYFSQQCDLDVFYDTECSGYAEAVVEKYVNTNESESAETEISETQTESSSITSAEEIAQVSVTGDATVDSILRETANVSNSTVIMEVAPVESTSTEETTAEEQPTEETVNEETVSESSSDVEESMDSTGNEESSESTDSSSDNDSESDSEGDSESEKSDSKSDKKKKLVAKRAKSLAEKMSDAASLEAQQAVQAQVLALISYVPDFDTYTRMMNGGSYADAQGYPDTKVPESKRGLRNGLAQQLLHEKMVDMQYE